MSTNAVKPSTSVSQAAPVPLSAVSDRSKDIPPEISNREVKSSVFTACFSRPENAAKLYTALEGVETSPDDIVYTTLQGVLFMARKNDLAFTVKNRVLIISEHQATVNENMPLRNVIYYGRTIEKLIPASHLYKKNRIPLPTPRFFVFYNGKENLPPEHFLKLSDAYLEKDNSPMLELITQVININPEKKHPVLEECRPLYEYSWFIQRIKDYIAKKLNRDDAVIQAIQDCLEKGIFVDFIHEHGSEVVNMLFTQFNMEDALEVRGEEMYQEGRIAGFIETCQDFHLTQADTFARVCEKFSLAEQDAKENIAQYWKK